jgi:hypothetical protein
MISSRRPSARLYSLANIMKITTGIPISNTTDSDIQDCARLLLLARLTPFQAAEFQPFIPAFLFRLNIFILFTFALEVTTHL